MTEAYNEYKKWLQWFIEQGGKPDVYRDYDFPNDTFIVARQNGYYKSGYGADHIKLIIPENVTYFRLNEVGFSDFYTYDKDFYQEKIVKNGGKNNPTVYQFKNLCLDFKSKEEEIERERLFLIQMQPDRIEHYDNIEHMRLSNLPSQN